MAGAAEIEASNFSKMISTRFVVLSHHLALPSHHNIITRSLLPILLLDDWPTFDGRNSFIMLRSSLLSSYSAFYPIGNTPATCLTPNLPPGHDADILLLGCGDARNILFTIQAQTGTLNPSFGYLELNKTQVLAHSISHAAIWSQLSSVRPALSSSLNRTDASKPATFCSSPSY